MVDELLVGVATQFVQALTSDSWRLLKRAVKSFAGRHNQDIQALDRQLEASHERLLSTPQSERSDVTRSEVAAWAAELSRVLDGANDPRSELRALSIELSVLTGSDPGIGQVHQYGSPGGDQSNQNATQGGINIAAGRDLRIR